MQRTGTAGGPGGDARGLERIEVNSLEPAFRPPGPYRGSPRGGREPPGLDLPPPRRLGPGPEGQPGGGHLGPTLLGGEGGQGPGVRDRDRGQPPHPGYAFPLDRGEGPGRPLQRPGLSGAELDRPAQQLQPAPDRSPVGELAGKLLPQYIRQEVGPLERATRGREVRTPFPGDDGETDRSDVTWVSYILPIGYSVLGYWRFENTRE